MFVSNGLECDSCRVELSISFADANLHVINDVLNDDGVTYAALVPVGINAWIIKTPRDERLRANMVLKNDTSNITTHVIIYDSDLEERKGDWFRPASELPQEVVELVKKITGVTLAL